MLLVSSQFQFGSVRFGLLQHSFLCELVFVGHKVHIKLHGRKSEIKEKRCQGETGEKACTSCNTKGSAMG